jgi:triacylglycerol lipase
MIVPRLRSPLVLVHGLFGFDELRLGDRILARYFRHVPEALRQGGNRVLVPRLSPTGGIAPRAAQLKVFLDRAVPGEPVHLFGHSLGGLDARYLISRLGMADRVLTLTTLGTPHRGTSFADWGLRWLGPFLRPFFDLFRVPSQAFADLTVASCQTFNEQVPDHPRVRYFSVAGRFRGGWLQPEWQMSGRLVALQEGPNDGVVSVASATYGESCEVWDGSHLNLVNWISPLAHVTGFGRDHTHDYVKLVRRLKDEGF